VRAAGGGAFRILEDLWVRVRVAPRLPRILRREHCVKTRKHIVPLLAHGNPDRPRLNLSLQWPWDVHKKGRRSASDPTNHGCPGWGGKLADCRGMQRDDKG
jgi:hypothetical protein